MTKRKNKWKIDEKVPSLGMAEAGVRWHKGKGRKVRKRKISGGYAIEIEI